MKIISLRALDNFSLSPSDLSIFLWYTNFLWLRFACELERVSAQFYHIIAGWQLMNNFKVFSPHKSLKSSDYHEKSPQLRASSFSVHFLLPVPSVWCSRERENSWKSAQLRKCDNAQRWSRRLCWYSIEHMWARKNSSERLRHMEATWNFSNMCAKLRDMQKPDT